MPEDERRVEVFAAERPRLLGICYRILGSLAEAEDAVQDAWLRWSRVDVDEVVVPEAMLTTIVTRLALDRLRRAKSRREVYPGSWLPEPVVVDDEPGSTAAELADSLSMALLVVLEALSPLERAAFVLREVFGRPYDEVAATLERSEPAVRQLVHRARGHVAAGHARYQADRETHAEVVRSFLAAVSSADVDELLRLLAPDVVLVSDGGGVARAPRRPIHGADKVSRLLAGFANRGPADGTITLEEFNGVLGIVVRVGGEPFGALALTVHDGAIQSLQLLTNPDKLRPLRDGGSVSLR